MRFFVNLVVTFWVTMHIFTYTRVCNGTVWQQFVNVLLSLDMNIQLTCMHNCIYLHKLGNRYVVL